MTIFFLLMGVMEFNKVCIRPGALFQVLFTLLMMTLAIVTYIMGFSAEGLKVVSTAYCGSLNDVLMYPSKTLPLFPKYIREHARNCLYDKRHGNLSILLPSDKYEQQIEIKTYMSRISDNDYSWIPYNDENKKMMYLKIFLNNYLKNYQSLNMSDFTISQNKEHEIYNNISQLNSALSCTSKKQL